MKTSIHPSTRLDDLDAREFEQMLASKSWGIYERRLIQMRGRLLESCATVDDEVNLRRAQGGVQYLSAVLDMPKTLLSEMKKKPNSPT
jgi:hypothetical protein